MKRLMQVWLLLIFALCASDAGAAAILSPQEIDLDRALGPPPAAGSVAEKQDLARVVAWLARRNSEDCDRAGREAFADSFQVFGPPDGPLTALDLRRWRAVIDGARESGAPVINEAKAHWKHLRPFVGHPEISVCRTFKAPSADEYSYPSGHATMAYLVAQVLGDLDPGRAPKFFARAAQIAEDRVIAGVHFPSDIEAGKKLGAAVYEALLRHPDFKRKLEGVRVRH